MTDIIKGKQTMGVRAKRILSNKGIVSLKFFFIYPNCKDPQIPNRNKKSAELKRTKMFASELKSKCIDDRYIEKYSVSKVIQNEKSEYFCIISESKRYVNVAPIIKTVRPLKNFEKSFIFWIFLTFCE